MNRRERRTAAARAKPGSAPADIAGLMAQANDAYRQRRLAQAEIVCKQILANASDHATCLNLLGVVYQTSGRHRLAVRQFAKAIALDDLDAGFHYNIACSYQALGDRGAAADHFKTAIMLGMGGKKNVEGFVRENPAIAQCIARIADPPALLGNQAVFGTGDIAAITNDLFLRRALELTTLHGVPLELFLTNLRAALLQLARDRALDAQVGEDIAGLFCALAQQCFINEYVYAQTDEETEQATRLRDLLVERLAAGNEIPPVLLAAVASYFPLYRLAGAKSLPGLAWPDFAADLVRQQVREPLAEAEDRPTIPALTAIDDATSIAVMRQYEENPYPRWTINPFIAAAADMKRMAAASDAREPHRGEDILIAGCGTGQHPFANAQDFPQARVLAIDVSRPSLAYARRKTREAGLQNIEYAQADILKLGGLGRSFDRIEALGVLHHLADPTAGWRVLLSLLRPDGIMRVGLYSEVARRAQVEVREFIAARGYRATAEDIRALRQAIVRNPRWNTLLDSGDFYTMSGCRDLLFHVMEHRFTIPEIAAFLERHGLQFLGFELDRKIVEIFQQQYPGASALTDLTHWSGFETANPDTFRRMYVFSVKRTERALR